MGTLTDTPTILIIGEVIVILFLWTAKCAVFSS